MDSMEKFCTNFNVHGVNTRHKHDFHQISADLTDCQKGAYYAGISLFRTLPNSIKSLNHDISIERLSSMSLLLLCRRIYFN
jgi:hypothetical protein